MAFPKGFRRHPTWSVGRVVRELRRSAITSGNADGGWHTPDHRKWLVVEDCLSSL